MYSNQTDKTLFYLALGSFGLSFCCAIFATICDSRGFIGLEVWFGFVSVCSIIGSAIATVALLKL